MTAQECLKAGDLDGALKALQSEIRNNPARKELRIFLFQLLCVRGEWERAMTQLNVAAELDLDSKLMAEMCRPALNSEAFRAEVFAGKRSPLIFGEPAAWVAQLVQALPLWTAGQVEAAAALRDQAFEAAPTVAGRIDDQPFAWIADADSRLGPMLEAVVDGRYYWIPFSNIQTIVFEEPKDLRDVVWLPAHFTWVNRGEAFGLIPVRYPGSEHSADAALRLARKTEWQDLGSDCFVGSGQRMLATDAGESPLLEVRRIAMEAAPASADAGPAAATDGDSHG